MQKILAAADAAHAQIGAGRRQSLKDEARLLARHCAQFRAPSTGRAIFQIATTAIPFLALVVAMIWLAEPAPWLTLLLGIPLGGLVVRFFIIQHDCGHGSFFASRRANDIVGRLVSVLTLTPYSLWRRVHAMHHAGSGNLDRRGAGDIETLTVREYLDLPWRRRVYYRVYRNPLFLFFIAVPTFFVLVQRLPWGHPLPAREVWKSVLGLDIALIAVYGVLVALIGLKILLLVALPAVLCASVIGGWLFFVQHQFEETAWDEGESWDFQMSAIHGSSHYDLPRVLNWFTGNIGLHHLHHLNSMVPNYRLQECLSTIPTEIPVTKLALLESFKCARLALWDETQRRLIRFCDIPKVQSA